MEVRSGSDHEPRAAGGEAPRRWRDQLLDCFSLALLILSALLLGLFHLAPGFGFAAGWEIWREVAELLRDLPTFMDEPVSAIGASSLICFCLWALASPLLVFVARRSRMVWWLMVLFSGLISTGLILVIITNTTSEYDPAWSVGGWCLFLSPLLNLAGLLLVRGRREKVISDQ